MHYYGYVEEGQAEAGPTTGLVWSGLAREWGGVGKHSILVVISLPGRES